MEERDLKEIVENFSYLASVKDEAMLRNILIDTHPADIANILRNLPDEYRDYVFGLLDAEVASQVVSELDDYSREQLLEELDTTRLSEIVDEMDSDDATDLVLDLPVDVAEKILDSIDKEDSQEVRELLHHEEDTAGGIMAMEFVSVDMDCTVDQAIQEIRTKAEEVEEVYNVYVVDKFGVLVGVLPLKKLILSNPKTKVSQLMERNVISVETDMDQEEVANIVKRYNLVAIPVVDKMGKLVGRITIDDIVDVMEEEASEDIQKMAGIEEEEFRETSTFKISRVRLPWLVVAFIGELLSALVLSHFQASINQILAVAFFIPIIMAMGGNSGIQSATIMIRGLATGEIGLIDARKRLLKEIRVSLVNGLICGVLIFMIITIWFDNPSFGLIIGAAMLIVILNAALVGAMIPLLLKHLAIDPAIATGPFITTSNDVLGLLIYLSLTTAFLK